MANHSPELLVPAGGMEQLESALLYGADAVYLGTGPLSLRSKCAGFSEPELAEAVEKAHSAGARLYFCLNAMPGERMLAEACRRIETLPELGADAVIVSDPGILSLVRKLAPGLEIHLSTQAHSMNSASAKFWHEAGARRINLARELSLEDIRATVSACPDIEFEAFVHGAMCLSLSGHCLMSAWANRRSANLGLCTQPCRFEYRGIRLSVEEAKRAGSTFLEVEEGEDFSGIWAPDDLCLLRWLGLLVDAGVHALKIEGRTKSGGYVAVAADVYRTAIGRISRQSRESDDGFMEAGLRELFSGSTRPLCSGFLFPERRYESTPSGMVLRPICARINGRNADGSLDISVRTLWNSSDDIEFLLPGMCRIRMRGGTYELYNHRDERVETLHPGIKGRLFCNKSDLPAGITAGIYLRPCGAYAQ